MTYCNYVQFSVFVCIINQFFKKKELLYRRWLLASLLWYLSENLNLLGLFDRNVGLTTKCAMVKVSANVVKDEPLYQTRVDTTNTKYKTLVECVHKNSRRLIRLTNQLKILHRAASTSLVDASLPTLSHCFSLRFNFPS